jgi:hypothetical protein
VAPTVAAPIPQVAAVASIQAPPTEGGFSRGGFNGGQPPTPEQIAAFREQMKARGMSDRGGPNAEGGGAPTDGGKRDGGKYSRGETSNAAPTAGAAPTSNKDDKRSRGGK